MGHRYRRISQGIVLQIFWKALFHHPGNRTLNSKTHRMDLTNDSYVILISGKIFTERYYRDRTGWLRKVLAAGRSG